MNSRHPKRTPYSWCLHRSEMGKWSTRTQLSESKISQTGADCFHHNKLALTQTSCWLFSVYTWNAPVKPKECANKSAFGKCQIWALLRTWNDSWITLGAKWKSGGGGKSMFKHVFEWVKHILEWSVPERSVRLIVFYWYYNISHKIPFQLQTWCLYFAWKAWTSRRRPPHHPCITLRL